jgi:hypothetical protein
MNTTIKTVVALPAGYDEVGCQVSLLRYRKEIIFWIDEKVDVDGEISNEMPEFVKNC